MTVPPSGLPGSVTEIDGAVLSTIRLLVVELELLPALSVVVARTSQAPSATAVVSQLHAYGELPSVQMGVQLPPEEGRASKATESTPEPASLAVALTAAEPVSGVAALTEVAGAVLSTRREPAVLVRE